MLAFSMPWPSPILVRSVVTLVQLMLPVPVRLRRTNPRGYGGVAKSFLLAAPLPVLAYRANIVHRQSLQMSPIRRLQDQLDP